MSLSGIVYHEGEQSHSGHYTSGVKINDSWVLISDSIVLRQHNLSCTKRDASVPYILIYKKRNDFVRCFSTSLNDKSESGSITQVSTELRAEMMNRQSVLNELEKQKKRMTIAAKRKDENNAKHACQPDICSAAQILELGKIKYVKRKRKYLKGINLLGKKFLRKKFLRNLFLRF